MKGFSIIICCYNSAKILPVTISYIAALREPEDWPVEVILVDNCCTDDTAKVAMETWHLYNAPWDFYIVEEKTPGLSAARIKGIETARYNYLVFCDDDNFLDKNYLIAASVILKEVPQIGALGGYAKALLEEHPAYWPKNFYIYGSGPQGDSNGETRTLHGAGIIVNKVAYRKLMRAKFNFILSDRKGSNLTSGGDYELCYAITLAGYKVWYDDSLKFSHYINANRVKLEYCRRFISESAPAVDVLQVYEHIMFNVRKGILSFYILRFRAILFHVWKIITSCWLRLKYSHDEQIKFLEKFHITFHFVRIKLIFRHVFKYPKTFRIIRLLQQRLSSLKNREVEEGKVKS